jgi:hypothetical protein
MTNSNLIRWGGVAAVFGGVFWVVWSILSRVGTGVAGGSLSDGSLFLAALLTLAGLAGLHALQGGNYGGIGRAGFFIATIGLLAQALGALLLMAGAEALWLVAPLGSLTVLAGLALYGVATLREGC